MELIREVDYPCGVEESQIPFWQGIQYVDLSESCIWREFPVVLLFSPKPDLLKMFAGRPMLTMLKKLKNSPLFGRSTGSAPNVAPKRVNRPRRVLKDHILFSF